MSLTPLVNLPSPSDPANFAAEADNFLTVQLPNLVTEWNTDIALFNNQDTRSTSTTSLLIGLGSKSLTVGTGKMYQPNMNIRVAHSTTVDAYMEGLITSYNSSTGALVFNSTVTGTVTGTLNSWNTFLVPFGYSGVNNSITSLTALVNPTFSAYLGTAQAIPNNTNTRVNINTEEFDTNSNFNTTTNRFTPTVAGYYEVTGQASFAANATGLCQILIYKNGAFVATTQVKNDSAAAPVISTSKLLSMNGSTDYIELFVVQSSGASMNITAGAGLTFFQASFVRSI